MIAEQEILDARIHEDALNALLQRNRKFLLVSAFRTCGRYISYSDDEYSVSVRAFHEAVCTWNREKGSFASFCSMVIRRRLIDYKKSEDRHKSEISVPGEILDGEVSEEETALESEIRHKLSEEGLTSHERKVREEIEEVQEILGGYGFSFYDLTTCSPKADKTRRACGALIRELAEDSELMNEMRQSRTLPAAELCRRCGIHKKIAERHRKYIIASAEIISGDYPLVREYIPYCRKGETL